VIQPDRYAHRTADLHSLGVRRNEQSVRAMDAFEFRCDRCGAVMFRAVDEPVPADSMTAFTAAIAEHRAVCPEQRPGLPCPFCHAFVAFGDIDSRPDERDMQRAIADHTAVCSNSPLGQTPRDLLEASDVDLLELLWEIVTMLPEDEMTPAQRAFYFAEHVNMEVENGGLVQYFMNTRGDEIADARAALRAIAADHHAAIFDRAVAIWEHERAAPNSCWANELDSRAFSESRIANLDDEWSAEDLTAIELRYARANADSLGRSA
jgi:hypothetical protein